MQETDKIKIIAENRKAKFEYDILNRYEAGLVLLGTEVKSLREGRVNINESYAKFINEELWLVNCHISEYKFGNINNHDPLRKRKLLLHRRERKKIKKDLQEKGLTMIPLKIYFKGSLIKVEMRICRGRKLHDKRENIKKRETERRLKRI